MRGWERRSDVDGYGNPNQHLYARTRPVPAELWVRRTAIAYDHAHTVHDGNTAELPTWIIRVLLQSAKSMSPKLRLRDANTDQKKRVRPRGTVVRGRLRR